MALSQEEKIRLYGLGLPAETAIALIPEKPDPDLTKKRKQQLKYLNAFIDSGGMSIESAADAGVKYDTVKWWRRSDPVFMEALELAKMESVAILEDEIIRRGLHGYEEPVFYQGRECGRIRKFSDNLIMFRAKFLQPGYKDGHQTNIGIAGQDVRISFVDPKEESPGAAPLLEAKIGAE